MVHFVGAGPGAVDLITVRGMKLLQKTDVIIYAGSLVNPELLDYAKEKCSIYDSSRMTLEEVISVMEAAHREKKDIVRLHTGDPGIFGAVREQMDELDRLGIEYESCPGVSSIFGAAASLNMEYTLPDVSQSVIITRMAGRTPVPERESIQAFASHGATMVLFLSVGMAEQVRQELLTGGYSKDTPAAVVYKATWADEKKVICTIDTLPRAVKENHIAKTALIIVGSVVTHTSYRRSDLYNPNFATEYREAVKKQL
ncbi:MAG: precorrin-4 C(11)-methyltransferase [Lachnospiraceae bacterium]|nr:precorrin-4 C(11)-methyltransferase [Lachnospiraceae bacterium]